MIDVGKQASKLKDFRKGLLAHTSDNLANLNGDFIQRKKTNLKKFLGELVNFFIS